MDPHYSGTAVGRFEFANIPAPDRSIRNFHGLELLIGPVFSGYRFIGGDVIGSHCLGKPTHDERLPKNKGKFSDSDVLFCWRIDVMCRQIMLVVTLFLTMVASARNKLNKLYWGEILNCQNQKCNFECLANGQWMRLGTPANQTLKTRVFHRLEGRRLFQVYG